MQQDSSEAFDLKRAAGILRRRLPLIVLCVVVATGAAYGFSKHQTKKYTATSSIVFNYNSLSQQIAGLAASGSSSSSALLAQEANNVELIKGGSTAAKTASIVGHGLTEKDIISSISVAGQGESGVVDVSATSISPALAAEIANTYAHQFVTDQQSADHQSFESALAVVNKQLARLSPRQRVGTDGLQLQDRAQTLSLLSELNDGDVQVAQEALVPSSPSSPKTSRNTALGLFLGLLVGLSLAFVLERFDRRIRGSEELERIYGLPSLGVVPKSAALARPARDSEGRRIALPAAEAEAFSLIRAHLRFFNVDRELRTVVITSAALGDGKTTIARHLAQVAAGLGSRVLLLEADLRHPTLAGRLGIQIGPGLADVLIEAIQLGEATQSVELDAESSSGRPMRTLDVLTAGAVSPPNPAELLESHAMNAVLEQARSTYDIVIVDTPPFTAVSDAFPLLTKVDGIVVVGWIGRSRRDSAEQLHRVLSSSSAPLLGVIANGTESGRPAGYRYARDSTPLSSGASVNGASPSEDLVPTAKV